MSLCKFGIHRPPFPCSFLIDLFIKLEALLVGCVVFLKKHVDKIKVLVLIYLGSIGNLRSNLIFLRIIRSGILTKHSFCKSCTHFLLSGRHQTPQLHCGTSLLLKHFQHVQVFLQFALSSLFQPDEPLKPLLSAYKSTDHLFECW